MPAGNALGVFDTGTTRTVLGAAAIGRGIRVILGSAAGAGGVPAATIPDDSVPGHGTAESPIANAGYGNIRQWNNGSVECVAAGAITAGVNVFAAAAGKVAATGTILIGVAEGSAAADGDLIAVTPSVENAA